MIAVTAIFRVKPENAAETEEILNPLIRGSRKDMGNIQYRCFADSGAPGTYVFHEVWENRECLDLHMKQHHFTEFGKQIAPLLLDEMELHMHEREID